MLRLAVSPPAQPILRAGLWTTSLWTTTLWIIALLALAFFLALAPLRWLILGPSGIAGGLLLLRYPPGAWLLLALLLPIAAGQRIGPAAASDLLLALALALWFANGVRKRSLPLTFPLPVWPALLYIGLLLLAALQARILDEAVREVVKWLEFASVLAIAPLAIPRPWGKWLIVALLTAAAGQALLGLYQFIFRIGPEWFLIQGRFMRAAGVFGQPNPFGGYLGLSLPVAVSLTLWAMTQLWSRPQRAATLRLAGLGVATAIIAAGLIASWSRGGWVGAAAALVVVLLLYSRQTRAALGLGGLGIAVAALVGALNPAWIPPAIQARLVGLPSIFGLGNVLAQEVNDDNFAVIERIAHWVAALRMWELAPWLGVGPGNYAAAYAQVALPRWPDPLGHAHNIYLNGLAESGILGLAAFLLLWGWLGGWLFHTTLTKLPAASWQRALAVGVCGVLTHLAVHNVFDNLFVQGILLHIGLWLVAVALCTRYWLAGTPPPTESDA